MIPALAVRRTAPLLAVALSTLTACASVQEAQDAPPQARQEAPQEPRPAAPKADRDVLRPCTRTDVLGAWVVVRMGAARAATVDRSDPEYYPHQRYVFSSNATMRYLAAKTPITRDDHRTMLAEPATTTWAVDDAGRLLTQRDGMPRQEVSTCAVLLREVQSEHSGVTGLPGDLLLTRLDAENRAVARRQLRRLESPAD